MFWATAVKQGLSHKECTNSDDHLSTVILDLASISSNYRKFTQVWLQINGSNHLLVNLIKQIFQFALDIGIAKGTKIELSVKGNGTVHLNGYMGPFDEVGSKDEKREDGSEEEDNRSKDGDDSADNKSDLLDTLNRDEDVYADSEASHIENDFTNSQTQNAQQSLNQNQSQSRGGLVNFGIGGQTNAQLQEIPQSLNQNQSQPLDGFQNSSFGSMSAMHASLSTNPFMVPNQSLERAGKSHCIRNYGMNIPPFQDHQQQNPLRGYMAQSSFNFSGFTPRPMAQQDLNRDSNTAFNAYREKISPAPHNPNAATSSTSSGENKTPKRNSKTGKRHANVPNNNDKKKKHKKK